MLNSRAASLIENSSLSFDLAIPRRAKSQKSTNAPFLLKGSIRLGSEAGSKDEYAIVLPGACHRWEVEENCQVLAVRWPSCTPSEEMPYIPRQPKSGIGQSYATYDLSHTALPFLVSESIQPPDLRCVSGIVVRYDEYIPNKMYIRSAKQGTVTLTLLMRGSAIMDFSCLNNRRIALRQNGDYAVTDISSLHFLRAMSRTATITVLWPSIAP